jgi:hypothetical protein
MTWEILMRIAMRIQNTHPTEALRLRLCASEVRHLETMATELVAEAVATEQAVAPLRKPQLRERA